MHRFFYVLLLSFLFALTLSAERYKVTDSYVSVYSDEERINKLGELQQGAEFESNKSVGNMLVFDYNGQCAFVASYCCKEIADDSATVSELKDIVSQQPQETSIKDDWADDTRKTSSIEKFVVGFAGNIFTIIFLLGIGMAVWMFVNRKGCMDFLTDKQEPALLAI